MYYQQRRNDEPFKEMSRVFQGSRGEVTLQPENSGNYTYIFVSLSDANYERVELEGPTINQVVHPLASASFSGNVGGGSSHRRSINSCSGSKISVDIDLRVCISFSDRLTRINYVRQGDGPWNLEAQVVSPKGSNALQFKDLKKARETIEVPIPTDVDEEGGSFQIDLVSVQDSYGCKKELTVPGMSVNVRRVKVRLSSHILICEHQSRHMPCSPLQDFIRKLENARPSFLRIKKPGCPCVLQAKA